MTKYKIDSERTSNPWWSRPDMPPVAQWWGIANYAELERECDARREA
jgi:hypothetical protein